MTKHLKLTAIRRITPESELRRPMITKLTLVERMEIRNRASKWTRGNVSEYLRYAALHFKPGKGDFQ